MNRGRSADERYRDGMQYKLRYIKRARFAECLKLCYYYCVGVAIMEGDARSRILVQIWTAIWREA
jgi:hypothetical protein